MKAFDEFVHRKLLNPEQFASELSEMKKTLWQAREKREHPFKDDKILTSWNGLMIYSLAEAGRAFDNKRYIDAAKNAADFIHKNLWKDGHLYHRWREGDAHYIGNLDDYAFLIRAVLSLFEIDLGTHWLNWAMEMARVVEKEFKVPDGAFYQTDGRDENILLRKCQFADGAEPSGNAVHCENLLRLYQLTLDQNYLTQAEDVLKAVKSYLDNYSPGYSFHLMNLMRYYDKHAPTLVVALEREEELSLSEIYQTFIPHKAVCVRHPDDKKLFDLIPYVKEQGPQNQKTTLYVCHHGMCERPLTDQEEIRQAIHKL